tara:strand:+ start:4716 stop:5708 length:993 start_codon:yes stop_codon:yes gene_type:complete
MANNNYNLSKEYQFDITVTDNTYAGKLALPYVTAAVKSPDTVAKGYVRTIDGLNRKAVISNLGINDPIVAASCSFSSGNDTSLTEQVLTLTDLKVNEEICRGTIFPTWIGENMDRNGNLPGTFEDFLLSTVAGKAAAQLENGIWVADASSIFGAGFLSNDGVFDQSGLNASACADFTQSTLNSGAATTNANIDDALATVFNAVVGSHPGLIDKPGFGFYMNNKMYGFYGQFLTASGSGQGINMKGSDQSIDGLTYLGYPIYRCPGMPDDAIVATYKENLVFGTNLATDWTEARVIPTYQYDGSDNVRIVMNFAIGVQTGVKNDGVVGCIF